MELYDVCADVPTMVNGTTAVDSAAHQLGWPGQRRYFTCAATARPLPAITWSRRGGLFVVDSAIYRVNTTTRQRTVSSTLEVHACI